jgi:hypothetical protein
MRLLRTVFLTLLAAGSLFGCSNSPDATQLTMVGAGSGGSAAVGSSAAGSTPSVGAAGAAGTGVLIQPAAGSSGTGSAAGSSGTGSAAGSSGTSAAGSGGMAVAAGSGGMAGMPMQAAGSGGSAGSPPPPSTRAKSACLKKASQVIFIGDSYINYDVAHTLLSTLIEQRAVMDGALKSGDHYRNYAVPGTALAAPNLLGMIPPQWDQAVSEDPDIKFVIMDGGGNDVLIDNMQCLAAGSDKDPGCQQVVADTLRVGSELITKIKMHGVSDGIYFFYPHVPAGGNDINDYSLKMLQSQSAALASDTFHTYVLDLIPIFEGHPDYIASDDIHANDVGENKIADAIWKIMKDNCIAQPESSGCCTP